MKPVPIPTVPASVTSGKRWTLRETAEQLTQIETMLTMRVALWQVRRTMKEKFGCGQHRVQKLIERVHEAWKIEFEGSKPHRRAEAGKRIFKQLNKCLAKLESKELTTADELKYMRQHAFYEQLAADFEGTRQPQQVDVNVTLQLNVTSLIASLSPEQIQESLAEYQENMRLAAAFKAAQPAQLPHKVG